MLIGKPRASFQFNNDLIVTEEIRIILLIKKGFLVVNLKSVFFAVGDVPFIKLQGQGFLINGFQKGRSQFIVHRHAGSHNVEALMLQD